MRLRDFEGRSRNRTQRGRRVHGPQPAEAAFRGGIGGSHEPHGLDVGRRTESRGPRGDLRTTGRSVYGSGAGTGGRRGGHPAGGDRFRHAQRQGGPLGHRHALRAAGPRDPRDGLRNARRRQRPHPLGADRRGLRRLGVACEPAVGRTELRLRGQAAAALPRTAGGSGRNAHLGAPERRASQRDGRLRRDARNVRRGCRRVYASRTGEHRGRLLRHDARPHIRIVENIRRLRPAACSRAETHHDLERSGAAADRPRSQLHQRRRTHERRRIGPFRKADPRSQLRRGALGGPRTGRRRGADRRRLHGRRADRRSGGDAHVPQPDGLGAGDRPRAGDDRLVEMGGTSSGT